MTFKRKFHPEQPWPSDYARWLREAKSFHTKFEADQGEDKEWEKWYGLFIAYRVIGYEATTSANFATEDIMEVRLHAVSL